MSINSRTIDEIDEAKEKEDLRKIEAVLFISGKYLAVPDFISYTDLNPIIIRELLERLQEKYDKNESSIELIKKGDLWKMDVKQEYSGIINRIATGSSEFTKAEQETLAIIAYKQPIKQSVVIKIRGNKAYDHVKKFVDLGLLKKKKIGHTNELSLSEDFYDYFNFRDKEDGGEIDAKEVVNSRQEGSEE
jgi:segregation and condensation protein B